MSCGRKLGPYDCCTVVQGDCLELMKALPDGCVDAVITDPPYGVEFRGNGWDKEIPDWLPTARRISGCVLFTTAPLTLWDYPRPDWVACFGRPASNSHSLLGGFNHWSPVPIYGKPKFQVDAINLHAIQHCAPEWNEHPTPKPDALMEWLCAHVGDTILDPFLGSGTTAVAAKKLGRHFLGFEISEEYCRIARERIALVEAQPNLFEPRAEQLTLGANAAGGGSE